VHDRSQPGGGRGHRPEIGAARGERGDHAEAPERAAQFALPAQLKTRQGEFIDGLLGEAVDGGAPPRGVE
jgi:hypothetical protein